LGHNPDENNKLARGFLYLFSCSKLTCSIFSAKPKKWAGVDSNHRKLPLMDLQSIPFSRSGTYPNTGGAVYQKDGKEQVFSRQIMPGMGKKRIF
jgi:hypothetical protein